MKKTLAMLLSFVLVASVCGMMFVSAEETNLALGKEVLNAAVNGNNPKYCANLTDGNAKAEISYDGEWFAFWLNPDATPEQIEQYSNTVDGLCIPTVDLGETASVASVRVNTFLGNNSGIGAPEYVAVSVSTDGETFTELEKKTFDFPAAGDNTVSWVEFELETPVDARYVRITMKNVITWAFINEIEVYGAAASEGGDEPEAPAKNYKDTLVEGEDGNYTCGVPYGYTWNIDEDGSIDGEDNVICVDQAAYDACNTSWAITVVLEKQEDGTYVAVQEAVAGAGAPPAITLGENQIALVAHSSYSNPNGTNWEGKVVAVSVKTGDVFKVSEDMTTVYAVVPGESLEDGPGDAGILVFAVLAVVAIAGCAVATKIKASAL